MIIPKSKGIKPLRVSYRSGLCFFISVLYVFASVNLPKRQNLTPTAKLHVSKGRKDANSFALAKRSVLNRREDGCLSILTGVTLEANSAITLPLRKKQKALHKKQRFECDLTSFNHSHCKNLSSWKLSCTCWNTAVFGKKSLKSSLRIEFVFVYLYFLLWLELTYRCSSLLAYCFRFPVLQLWMYNADATLLLCSVSTRREIPVLLYETRKPTYACLTSNTLFTSMPSSHLDAFQTQWLYIILLDNSLVNVWENLIIACLRWIINPGVINL